MCLPIPQVPGPYGFSAPRLKHRRRERAARTRRAWGYFMLMLEEGVPEGLDGTVAGERVKRAVSALEIRAQERVKGAVGRN